MVFYNTYCDKPLLEDGEVTILILVDGFLQYINNFSKSLINDVTILILVDGFLQYKKMNGLTKVKLVTILILVDGFLQSANTYTSP